MTRRRKKPYWRPLGAPKQRTLDEAWRMAEGVAKGEEAERAALARLHEQSIDAEKTRNRGLVLQAWKLALDELFPKKTQLNLAKRNMLQDLLVWIATAGKTGLTISYKTMKEVKGYKRTTLNDALRELCEAKLIVKTKTYRSESVDGSQRDQGPNLYRVDWVGVVSRLAAASEGGAAPVAEPSYDPRPAPADAEDDDDSYAPAVEVRPVSYSPESPDFGGYAETRHSAAAPARQRRAADARQRPAAQARQPYISDKDLTTSPPSPPAEPSTVAAPAVGERALPARAAAADFSVVSWGQAKSRLFAIELSSQGVQEALEIARKRGYEPREVARLCDVFLEFRDAFNSPGAIIHRLKADPGRDELLDWPNPKRPLVRRPPPPPDAYAKALGDGWGTLTESEFREAYAWLLRYVKDVPAEAIALGMDRAVDDWRRKHFGDAPSKEAP